MLKQICKVGELCGCGFKNTGANFREVWAEITQVMKKKMWCQECLDHGLLSMSGLRDHIKVGIGGMPFNVSNYEKFVSEVNCVYKKYLERKNQFGGFK